MASNKSLFASFPPSSKADWLAKISADLKGKPIETLDWQLEKSIRLSPVYSAEDLSDPPSITAQKNNNNWQIGEYIDVEDMKQANTDILEGLIGGVNAPLIRLGHLPTVDELAILLKGVEPDFINIHFEPKHAGKDPAELFRNLIFFARKQGFELSSIKGSVDFDPLLDWANPPFKPLARILKFAGHYVPHFKVMQVNGRVFHTGIENGSLELALILSKGVEYLDQMEKLGIPPAQTNAHLQFSVAISSSYFVEIAKLRALRILWANVMNAYELKNENTPPLLVHFASESQTNDVEMNKIRAATQAMAAVIGGADTVFIPPSDAKQNKKSTSFTRRIARNVQHLLQMESHLDRVVDPAAGSYYIESLTKELCEHAWAKFQSFEAQGGFMELERLGE